MVAGATQTFAATVTGDATLSAGVTWTASVGSITVGGVYTAPTPVPATSATITATSKTDTTKSTTATVTFTPISVAITTTPVAMVAGATQTFAATVSNDITPSAGVTWSASVGSITALGVYTAPTPVSVATATITATSKTDTSKTNTATVTLTPIAVSITTTPVAMVAGATQTFAATVSNDITPNAGVTWTASVGSITAGGVYTAPTPVSVATATITATSKTDTSKTNTATVTLTPIAVTIPTTPTAIAGAATEAITATLTGDATLNAGVTWSITSGGGSLTAVTTSSVTYNAPLPVTTATAVITATSKTDTTKTATFTIPLTPISVGAIRPAPISLGTSTTQPLVGATVSNDSSNSGVTWSISPAAGAGSIVSTTGVYTAPTSVISTVTTVTVTATSVKDPTKTATATITLQPITIDAISPATVSLNGGGTQSFSGASLTYDGSSSGVTWSISPATGAGSVSTTGVYTAPAVVSGSSPVTVTVTVASVKDNTKTTTATITLTPIGISFTTATTGITLDSGQTLTLAAALTNDSSASGAGFATTGAGTVAPASAAGNAPATTLTATGTSASTVSVIATSTKDNTKTATTSAIIVNPAITFSPASGALTAGTTNTAYPGPTIAASGGTGIKTFVLASGALPAPLTLSSAGVISTGTITGTAGTYSFTVKATDTATTPATVFSGTYTITITAAPLVWGSVTGGTYTVGTAITPITLSTTGGTGTITYTVASGTLPTGLSIVGSQVIGTPTAPTVVGGNVLTFKATDSASTPVTATSASVTLIANPVTLAVSTPTLPTGFVNSAYNGTGYQFLSTGGTGTITWTMSPANVATGMTLSTSGLLSGTPTATYASTISVTATDSATNQQQTKNITPSLTVSNALTVTTGQSSLPIAYTSQSYSTTLAASGGSGSGYTWTVTAGLTGANSLAALNLSVNSSSGLITGTPSATGIATFTVQVTDSVNHTASAIFSITAYAPLTLATPSASVPGPGTVGVSYTASIAALGGVPAYTYTVNGSVLVTNATVSLGDNLSITNSGGTVLNITGTPTALNSGFTFTVKVSDTASNTVGAYTYTIVVNNPLTITTQQTGLPYAYVNQAYTSTTLVATGGNGTNTWSVTSGLTGNNSLQTLNLAVSPTGVITGTPAIEGSATFTVLVADTASHTATASYTIFATTPLSIPATNPSSLGPATTTGSYTGSITVTGGIANYTWTVNGSTNSAFTLNNGTLSASVNNYTKTLSITGTPSTPGTVSLTVSVKDAAGTTVGPTTYTIAVSTAYNISGQIRLDNACGYSSVPTISLALKQGSNIIQTQTTDSNGNFTFTGIANGAYTITPSISVPTSVFYPATPTVTVASSNITNSNFSVALGYTVSGSVAYTGSQTGPIYLSLNPTGNCGGGTVGTSISAKGTYTIRGVEPGAYTLQAYMDNLGKGAANASNPAGSSSVTVATANITGANVTLSDPSMVTLNSNPVLQGGGGFNIGAMIVYKAITNSNNVETATSYTLQWSTTAAFTAVAGTKNFPAMGDNGATLWMLNTASSPSLTSGGTFWFRAYGTSAGTSQSSYSNVLGPFTISPPNPTGGNAVSGAVTFTGTAAGPLGVGFFDQNTGNFYGQGFANPASAQAYTIQVPNGSNYIFVGILDQNNDGIIDAGDLQNTTHNNTVTVISGPTSSLSLTLSSASSTAAVTTQNRKDLTNGGTTVQSYALSFQVNGLVKQPVAVALTSSTNSDGANVVTPMDIALCGGNNCEWGFSIYLPIGGTSPAVGDAYTFAITYSDATTGNLTATITNVMNAFATYLSPAGTSSSLTPTMSWTDPALASNYTYHFYMQDSSYNTVWQIPGSNSKSNGLTSSTTSLTWGTDPTDSNNKPNPTTLNSGQTYSWRIEVDDSNGNSTQQWVTFVAP
jgi:hypothetical protein